MDSGDAGGVFAGVVAGLYAIGKGLAWLLNWQNARGEDRSKRLKVWEESLDRRERDLRLSMEAELGELRDEVEAQGRDLADQTAINQLTRMALVEVTTELERRAADSLALQRAKALLHRTEPNALLLPSDIATLARAADERSTS